MAHTLVGATISTADRIAGALWGIYIADALAMPVHWYYDVGALRRDFGAIRDYQAPKDRHPSSIMTLSSTGGHGRGGQEGRVIGDVINHGKRKYWGVKDMHYHQGMQAGENTLNALCARVVTRGVAASHGRYDASRFLQDYVQFMTTPGSHNDTYAESFHRDFFANYARGVKPEHCSRGTEGHNTASIGGFVMLPPVTLSFLRGKGSSSGGIGSGAGSGSDGSNGGNAGGGGGGGGGGDSIDGSWEAARQATLLHLGMTHESTKLARAAEVYSRLLWDVAGGADLRTAVEGAASSLGLDLGAALRSGADDVQVVHRKFGSACYIDSSLPCVLYLAHKHADSFEDAVLANVNAGGENCHRGAALGALMGAAHGRSGIPTRLIEGLHDSREIGPEIDAYVTAVLTRDEAGSASQTDKSEL